MFDNTDDIHPLLANAPTTTEFKKLRKRIVRNVREAIDAYGMVAPEARSGKGGPEARSGKGGPEARSGKGGPEARSGKGGPEARSGKGRPEARSGRGGPEAKWMVALSGGKDSYTLLAVLYELRWRGLLPVELLAVNLDQGQPEFPATVLPEFLERMGVPHRIEYQDTYSVVMDKIPEGRTYCALCSRLRRGNLYRIAREEGCSAVVLGHHRDDILETFFLNLFHGSRLATMPPKLVNEDGDLLVLRPLAFVAEADCERFAAAMNYPIIPCDLCGSQDGLQRQQVKAMLDEWERRAPGRRQKMFNALSNARPSHLLDPALFDFAALHVGLDAALDVSLDVSQDRTGNAPDKT